MKLTHKGEELVAIDRCFDVEIETVFELTLGDLAAFELDQVYTGGIETGHYAEERSGAVGDVYHHTCTVGTGIYFRLFGYAYKAGVIVVAVLNRGFENLHLV